MHGFFIVRGVDRITSQLHSWHYSYLLVLSVLTHLLTRTRNNKLFYTFEVFNIQNWALDHGSELHHQEKGCGALTGWSWTDASSTSMAKAYFNLPITMKGGCVERAIVSAGGPKISCHSDGTVNGLKSRRREPVVDDGASNSPDDELGRREDKTLARVALQRAVAEDNETKNRETMRKRAATTEGPSRLSLTDTPTYTYPSTLTTSTYDPMTWDANNTVVLTWTLTNTDVDQVTYTYTSTIPGYTYTDVSTTSSSPTSTSLSSSGTLAATSLPTACMPISPLPSGHYCGRVGLPVAAVDVGALVSYDAGSPYVSSLSACSTMCLNTPACSGFFFVQGGKCHLRYGPNSFSPNGSSGSSPYYETSCFSCPSTATCALDTSAAAYCGRVGVPIAASNVGALTSYDTGSPYVYSVGVCAAKCLNTPTCSSFFFLKGEKCHLRYGPISFSPNGSSGSSPFYDIACFPSC